MYKSVRLIEANDALTSSNVNADGSVDITTGFDGSWKQRGFTSNQKLVVHSCWTEQWEGPRRHHMTINCPTCTKSKNDRDEGRLSEIAYLEKLVAHNDNCRKNYDKSPQSMEVAGTTQI